jgi:DNA-binding response OmpR family regulator
LLITEDERDLLEVLTDKFERNGFEAFGAKNGEGGKQR